MTEWSWITYRRNSSAGSGQWEYMEVGTEDLRTLSPDDFAGHYLESSHDDHSEHFRGYEWHHIQAPPPFHLVDVIENQRRKIAALQKSIERHQKLLVEGPVYDTP